MFNASTIASLDIMSKGMLGSFAVAVILAILTMIAVRIFHKQKQG
jgi:hypothetical protein